MKSSFSSALRLNCCFTWARQRSSSDATWRRDNVNTGHGGGQQPRDMQDKRGCSRSCLAQYAWCTPVRSKFSNGAQASNREEHGEHEDELRGQRHVSQHGPRREVTANHSALTLKSGTGRGSIGKTGSQQGDRSDIHLHLPALLDEHDVIGLCQWCARTNQSGAPTGYPYLRAAKESGVQRGAGAMCGATCRLTWLKSIMMVRRSVRSGYLSKQARHGVSAPWNWRSRALDSSQVTWSRRHVLAAPS